eukprot:5219416-Amphidinium_carterae.1
MFLVQHYSHRVQHIFQTAGATAEQYQQILQNLDKKAGNHFTEVNRRTLATIRQQTPAEMQREVERLHPERFEQVQRQIIREVPEDQEIHENYDYEETRSTTRASGSTSLKRKSTAETPETKKQQAETIINFYNTSIN